LLKNVFNIKSCVVAKPYYRFIKNRKYFYKKLIPSLKYLWKPGYNSWVIDFIVLTYIGLLNKSLDYIILYWKWNFIKYRRHTNFIELFIKIIKRIYKWRKSKLLSIRIVASGPFNRHSRTKAFIWSVGNKIQGNSYNKHILYDSIDCPLQFGAFTVHIWLAFR